MILAHYYQQIPAYCKAKAAFRVPLFLLFFLLPAMAAAPGAAQAGTLQIPQGGVARVEVTIQPGDSAPWGSYRARTVRFAAVSETRFVGLVGVDMQSDPGASPMEVRVLRAGESLILDRFTVEVTPVDFPEQRVEGVPDSKVNLSQENLERAGREKADVQRLWESGAENPLWNDGWIMPVDASPSGRFAHRRVFNGQPRSPHNGEDFPAPEGTPVIAPNEGIVRLAGDRFFGGNTVFLEHGGELFTFYMHLLEVTVTDGQRVHAGDLIGKVGATGRATGPHLHWGGRLGGSRINPLFLVKGAPVYVAGATSEVSVR
ncbi:MAG: M23 family metallopeptidase [Nitrospirota bacterium]|nr:M23 family metallopeptidase [Nitrospirota bacterium]